MNIILFVNKDLEANLLYNLLKPELLQHNVKIYYTAGVGKAQGKPKALQEIEYYENDYFFENVVDYIKTNALETSFEFFGADFSSFEFLPCGNVNSPAFIAEVSAFKPDLFISIRFGKIFREGIISIKVF